MGDEGPIPGHFVVGLTGGIASGKSAACARFAEHGVAVFDADVAARDVVRRGQPAFAAIVGHFGRDIVGADEELDRRKLRGRVFTDSAQRKVLEAIVHPRVRAWLRAKVLADRSLYCILAIPLLAETWPQYAWVDRVAVVDVPQDVQVRRLMFRDGITAELAESMQRAQASRERRLALADDVIDNSGELAYLVSQVDELHRHYLALSQKRDAT